MSHYNESEFELDEKNQGQNPTRLFSLKQTGSAFLTKQLKPHCKLLILGDYEHSEHSKKRELLSASNIEELKVNNRDTKLCFSTQENVQILITDFSRYDRIVATPAYRAATMIVVIPNSAEDLRIWYNSINDLKHQPPKNCKIVYLNLFELNSEDYKSIESKVEELNASACKQKKNYNESTYTLEKLDLQPATLDNIINTAVQHTLQVVELITLPDKSTVAVPNSTTTGGCSLL